MLVGAYFDAKKTKGDDSLCAICLAKFQHREEVVPLQCNESHAFHRKCIEDLVMKDKYTCPICRKEISFMPQSEDNNTFNEEDNESVPAAINNA